MRLAVMVASVVSMSALLVLAACGDQTTDSTDTPTDEDAGTPKKKPSSSSSSSSSGSSGDPTPTPDGGTSSSSSSGGPKPTGSQLVNEPVVLWGITDDGMVVYQPLPAAQGQTSPLEAIPLVGGAKVTIAAQLADTDVVTVAGGAVAWWTTIANGLGSVNVWTKTNGAKTAVATGSIPEIFSASPDGSRIAFSVSGVMDLTDPANPAPKSTALAVTGSATPSATALKSGATTLTIDFTKPDCSPDTAFAGNVFVTGHCTATSTTPGLWAVGPAGTAFTRLDTSSPTTSRVTPMVDGTFWSASSDGSKIFALVGAAAKTGRVFDATGAQVTASLDTGIEEGLMLKDGSAVVYRNATTLMRGTTVASPVKTNLLANGTTPKSILLLSADGNRVAFNTMDPPASGAPLIDIRVVDTTSAAQVPKDIVATGTGYPVGFTGDSAHVLYYTDVTATGMNLKTKTPLGANETTLGTNIVGARPAQTGSGVLLRTNKQKDASGLTVYDLQSIDAAAGGAPKTIATGVPSGLYDVSGAKLVYVSFDKTYAGLYVTDLP